VSVYDGMDHSGKAYCMGAGIYSRLRYASGRRCEIFHDSFLYFHVGIPGEPLRVLMPCDGIWTDRCMDRNVYGLDGAGDRVYVPFPQQKVAGTSGDSLSN